MPDYFTLPEFRALPDMSDDAQYPDARVEAVAAALTTIVERGVGTSFVPRTYTKTLYLVNGSPVLPTPYVLEVTGVVGGVADWWSTTSTATVTYDAGYSATPPADIKEALMWATRDRLLATDSNAGTDARRTSQVTDVGTINFIVAGKDHPTGYPDLDAAIMGWHSKLFGLGFI